MENTDAFKKNFERLPDLMYIIIFHDDEHIRVSTLEYVRKIVYIDVVYWKIVDILKVFLDTIKTDDYYKSRSIEYSERVKNVQNELWMQRLNYGKPE